MFDLDTSIIRMQLVFITLVENLTIVCLSTFSHVLVEFDVVFESTFRMILTSLALSSNSPEGTLIEVSVK